MAATLGKIYATAPTHAVTDKFADRLGRITQRVTSRRNMGKLPGDKTRARRTLVLRAYNRDDEVDAFINTLRDPYIGDEAAPSRNWGPDAKWKLNLSPSFWLLMILRSPAVRELHEDDSPALHQIQAEIDRSPLSERLRAVATGAISWQEYQSGSMVSRKVLNGTMGKIFWAADILCTTPAMSCEQPFRTWKETAAKGIAVDEAGNISRPDLYSVWGNTLLPCLLGGDDKQLPLAVMTLEERDEQGNYLNRFGQHGKISALEFFKGSGWPIFRLRI